MARLEALTHITHDNKAVAVGEQFDCSDAVAEALVADGAAKAVAEAPEPKAAVAKAPETKKKAAQAK